MSSKKIHFDDPEYRFLTTKEAAIILGVSPGQLKLSRVNGYLFKGVPAPPFIKMSRAVRYQYIDLMSWGAKQEKFKTTSDYPAKREAS